MQTAGPGATRLLDGTLEAVSLQRTIARGIDGEGRSRPDLGEKSCLLSRTQDVRRYRRLIFVSTIGKDADVCIASSRVTAVGVER